MKLEDEVDFLRKADDILLHMAARIKEQEALIQELDRDGHDTSSARVNFRR